MWHDDLIGITDMFNVSFIFNDVYVIFTKFLVVTVLSSSPHGDAEHPHVVV